jgi:uncharacterized protein (DUF362 family)
MTHKILFDVGIIIQDTLNYPEKCPFNPERIFPELQHLGLSETDLSNKLYSNIRQLFVDMQLDSERIGTQLWNPLSDFINSGDIVVIKPNLVLHHNRESRDINAIVAHASVIRPLIDYCLLALKGSGSVIIGDAPHGDADFEKIIKTNGLLDLVNWYKNKRGIDIELRDFRKYIYPRGFDISVCKEVNSDPDGYILVNLKDNSFLEGLPHLNRLYGSDYDRSFIVKQHLDGNHHYLISGTVLNADVVISVPKLKTHKKTGITINLKNLVGINGDKNYLAHFRVGSPSQGGDEYPDSKSIIENILRAYNRFSRKFLLAPNQLILRHVNRILRIPFLIINKLYRTLFYGQLIGGGNWYGNDTCWRMCLDLNYILQYADKEGILRNTPQRRYFCLVDGVISGEGEGPMEPDPKYSGVLAGGKNPYKTDFVCTKVMGFDPLKLKLLSEAISNNVIGFHPEEIKVIARKESLIVKFEEINLKFNPHPAWKDKIERNG